MSALLRRLCTARVSTEDRQSPTDSIAWQRALATSLIAAQGGRIVAEYLDVGVSRSLPWPRRPKQHDSSRTAPAVIVRSARS